MRVASLVPSSTEILFAIGAGSEVVARTHECDHPADAGAIRPVTSSFVASGVPTRLVDAPTGAPSGDRHTIYTVDDGALAGTAPDLVFTQGVCEVCAVERSDAAACTMPLGSRIVSSDPHTLEDVFGSIIEIAAAVGRAQQGRALTARLRSRLHWVTAAVADLEAPRVAVIEWPDPLHAPGRWVPEMVEAAGGINVFGASAKPSRPTTLEDLAAARPDVVFVAFRGQRLYETQLRFKQLLAEPTFTAATRFARIFAVDGAAYFSRPGPRLVEGIELMAWSMHRSHETLRPPVGRAAKLIEAGWVDVSSLPLEASG